MCAGLHVCECLCTSEVNPGVSVTLLAQAIFYLGEGQGPSLAWNFLSRLAGWLVSLSLLPRAGISNVPVCPILLFYFLMWVLRSELTSLTERSP